MCSNMYHHTKATHVNSMFIYRHEGLDVGINFDPILMQITRYNVTSHVGGENLCSGESFGSSAVGAEMVEIVLYI